MKKPNSLPQVIDMETEQFLTYIHNISNLTELLSLKKLLEAEYQRVCLVKDGLLEMRKSNKYNSKSTPETVEESLAQLYSVLLVIEHKVLSLNDELKLRRVE